MKLTSSWDVQNSIRCNDHTRVINKEEPSALEALPPEVPANDNLLMDLRKEIEPTRKTQGEDSTTSLISSNRMGIIYKVLFMEIHFVLLAFERVTCETVLRAKHRNFCLGLATNKLPKDYHGPTVAESLGSSNIFASCGLGCGESIASSLS